jgi:hypothetical protein
LVDFTEFRRNVADSATSDSLKIGAVHQKIGTVYQKNGTVHQKIGAKIGFSHLQLFSLRRIFKHWGDRVKDHSGA